MSQQSAALPAFRLPLVLSASILLLFAADASASEDSSFAAQAGTASTRGLFPGTWLLYQSDGEGEFTTGETGGAGDGSSASDLLPKYTDMNDSVTRDVHEGLVEFWVGAYMWLDPGLIAKGKASQKDLRLAHTQGVLYAEHGIGIGTIDFKDELGLDDRPEALYQQMQIEIGARFENNVFRILWWMWENNQDRDDWVWIKQRRAFGDKVFYEGCPIRMPFRMMDTKLIYEYRVIPWERFELFLGIALHWIYTIDYNALFDAFPELGYEHSSAVVHSSTGLADFVDKPVDEDPSSGHYPMASISLRFDLRPVEGIHVTFDVQEMYVYYGNYVDLRAGIWNEIAGGVRIGAGYRLWAVTADVHEVGGQKTNFTGRAVFQGVWLGLFVRL